MHLPNTLLDTPECLITAIAASAAVGAGLAQMRREQHRRPAATFGLMAAGIFAAQMVNYPIAVGTSGHLLGAALAAIVLGPWAGMIAMSLVLVVQCLLFGDGGLNALGANILNMGIIAPWVAYGVYKSLGRYAQSIPAKAAAAALAAWCSVMAAAFACAAELAMSGKIAIGEIVPPMLQIHAVIGISEALFTAAAVTILATIPARAIAKSARRSMLIALSLIVAAAIFLPPLASQLPDGLESVVEHLGLTSSETAGAYHAPMAEYALPGESNVWLATAIAGTIGVLIVFAAGWGLRRAAHRSIV